MVKEEWFCGLSNEEKRLIKEKKNDIKLDFSIKCFGYADVYEICYEDSFDLILDVLEKHLPFIKEQKEIMLEMYEENGYEIDDIELEDFVDYIYKIIGDITVDKEKQKKKLK